MPEAYTFKLTVSASGYKTEKRLVNVDKGKDKTVMDELVVLTPYSAS